MLRLLQSFPAILCDLSGQPPPSHDRWQCEGYSVMEKTATTNTVGMGTFLTAQGFSTEMSIRWGNTKALHSRLPRLARWQARLSPGLRLCGIRATAKIIRALTIQVRHCSRRNQKCFTVETSRSRSLTIRSWFLFCCLPSERYLYS